MHKIASTCTLLGWFISAYPRSARAEDFDLITTSHPSSNVTLVQIDRPDVRLASKAYPNIKFQPGQTVRIDAGGCVRVGGQGKNWRDYVNPKGQNSDHLYRGEIAIPGITNGLTWFQNLAGHTYTIAANTPPNSSLELGYVDNKPSDNGYTKHDDGIDGQCKGIGPAFVRLTITTTATADADPFVQKRIAGIAYFHLNEKDSKDRVSATNGFLCVVHNPGCGIKGNDGTDLMFRPGLQLPAQVTLDAYLFDSFSPTGLPLNDGGGIGGQGSYGVTQNPQKVTLPQPISYRWHNACQGVYGGKNNFYVITMLVTAPKSMDLGEQAFDPAAGGQQQCATNGFSDTGNVTQPIAATTSGFEGSVRVCDEGGPATLHLEAICSPPTSGLPNVCVMNEDIPLTLAQQPAAFVSTFRTKQIYKVGTWRVTKASVTQKNMQATQLSDLSKTYQLPGLEGTPILDFTNGACLR